MNGHCLVVGGTKGIGLAVAKRMKATGDTVSIIGRGPQASDDLPGDFYAEDLLKSGRGLAAARKAVKRRGKLASLVFSQRYRGQGDAWSGELAVSVAATRELIEGLREDLAPGGAIVVVGSLADRFVADDSGPGYHAAKAALRQLVRYYAVALAPAVRVNMVLPGLVLKPEAEEFYKRNAKLHDLLKRITPLGRMARLGEIASVIAFLCGPEASFVTGQELVADGGLSLAFAPSLARKLVRVETK